MVLRLQGPRAKALSDLEQQTQDLGANWHPLLKTVALGDIELRLGLQQTSREAGGGSFLHTGGGCLSSCTKTRQEATRPHHPPRPTHEALQP